MKQKNLSLVLTSDISISKITNFKDKFSSEIYKNKAERILFWICFCFAIAYARSLYVCAYAYVDAYVAHFGGYLCFVLPCAYCYVD